MQAYFFTQGLPKPSERRRWLLLVFSISLLLVLLPMDIPDLIGGKPWVEIAYSSFIVLTLVFCLVTTGILFMDKTVPSIGQANILSFTMIFWLVCFKHFDGFGLGTSFLISFGSVATLGTLLVILLKAQLNFLGKLFFYSWFLFINVYLCSFQVLLGDFRLVDMDRGWEFLGHYHYLSAFFSGMAILFFTVYGFYFSLALGSLVKLAFKGSRQAKAKGGKKWEDAEMMISHLSDYQIGIKEALLIILFQGGLYLLNEWHPFSQCRCWLIFRSSSCHLF